MTPGPFARRTRAITALSPGQAVTTRALCVAVAALALACGAARADDLRDGDRALETGRLEEAMRHYEAAVRDGRAAGHVGIGNVWLQKGLLASARQAFGLALEMDPDLAAAHAGQGEMLKREGKCAEAIPRFERATQLDRKFPEAQLGLGECLAATGQIERAVAELSRGIKWGRVWAPRFYAARGAAWMAADSLRKAAADLTRAREMAPKDASIRRAIGHFYVERGTWSLAIPELEAAIALDSTAAEAQYELARALFYDRRYDQALGVYEGLLARHPQHARARLGLGDLLFRAGDADPRRYAEAQVHLREYVRLEPGDAKGWSLLGRTWYRMGQADSALVALLEAERLGEQGPEFFTTLGLAHVDHKQWEEARVALERGELGPREEKILAQIYEFTGHPGRADSLYRIVLARDSTSAEAAFALGQMAKLQFRSGSFAAAESIFRRATALDARNGEALFYRGLCLKELGRPSEALAVLREAAAIDTAKADRFFWLGVLLDSEKQVEEAARAFRRSAELDSTGEMATRSWRQLGYYALLEKKWDAAIRSLERAVEIDPSDPQAWLWLGQGNHNAGRRNRAAECYRRVLSLDPGNTVAKKGLEVLGARAEPQPRTETPKETPTAIVDPER